MNIKTKNYHPLMKLQLLLIYLITTLLKEKKTNLVRSSKNIKKRTDHDVCDDRTKRTLESPKTALDCGLQLTFSQMSRIKKKWHSDVSAICHPLVTESQLVL